MNATTTFATRTRPDKAAQRAKPRSARRSFFSKMQMLLLSWLMSYPVEIV